MSNKKTAPTARQIAESVKPFVGMASTAGANLVAIAAAILASMAEAANRETQNEIIRELHENVSKLPDALARELQSQQDAHWAAIEKQNADRGPFVAAVTDPYIRKGKDAAKKNRVPSSICINGGNYNYRRNTWLSANVVRQMLSLTEEQRAELKDQCDACDAATLAFDQANGW